MKKSELTQLIENKVKKKLSEAGVEKTRLPSNIQRSMTIMTKYLKQADLTKQQQLAALYQLIKELGIDITDLTAYITRIKLIMRQNKNEK